MGKTVITCGNAFYNGLSNVFNVKNEFLLINTLDFLLEKTKGFNQDNDAFCFFEIFCNKYCIRKNEIAFIKLFSNNLS